MFNVSCISKSPHFRGVGVPCSVQMYIHVHVPVECFACVNVDQLYYVSIPYWAGIGIVGHAIRTGTRFPDLPQVVDVCKLIAGDLLLVGGASVIGILEGVEVRVGVEPAEEIGGTQGQV